MTTEELNLLQTTEVRKAIEENLGRDPIKVALDKRLPHPALVASQVKYLDRARKKLPSYYAARCIIPSLAFEQSSSELTGEHKNFQGELCIDLTCGLGIDTHSLSKRFDKVISVERDPILAEIARINFSRLGADNITVINDSAENFIERFLSEGRHADLIYADPDRRGTDGKKLVRLEDCSPDITTMLPSLRKAAKHIAIKTSPLFDVAEAFRIFGEHTLVDVISLAGECKEVLIESAPELASTIKASALGVGTVEFPWPIPSNPDAVFTPPYSYMIIPDVALRKARITSAYSAAALPGSFTNHGDGYVFTNDLPGERPLGKIFEIISMAEYSPRKLKKDLRERGIKSAQIHLLNFPQTSAVICRELGVKEGGSVKLAFTTIGSALWTIELKELPLQ